jgi:hypothetical protein
MTRINTKLPVTFVMRSAIMSLILLGFIVFVLLNRPTFLVDKSNYQPIIFVTSVLVIISLFDLYLRKGYSIWYDKESICWRKVGLSRSESAVVCLKFDDIGSANSVAGGIYLDHFEAISLRSNDCSTEIIISRQYVRDEDVIELLDRVKSLSSATFDRDLMQFIDSFALNRAC